MFNLFRRLGNEKKIVYIPMDMISQNPNQPRKYFEPSSMDELKNSIREFGLIQPITVRKIGTEYELISGERRFRACQMLDYEKIPAIVMDADVKESALLSLLENLHREDLSFFEIAQSYENLIHNQGMTTLEAAAKTGGTKLGITNKIRLLQLSPFVKKLVRSYNLTENQAKALLRISDEKRRIEAAQTICLNKLTLEQTYDLIDAVADGEKKKKAHKEKTPERAAVFKNTVKRALDIIKSGGTDAEFSEKSFDWGTEYVIKIKNKTPLKKEIKKESTEEKTITEVSAK